MYKMYMCVCMYIMYVLMYEEHLKTHNKFLVCLVHLSNKADSVNSDADSDSDTAQHKVIDRSPNQ